MIFKGQESSFNNTDMISVFFLSLAKIKNNYILQVQIIPGLIISISLKEQTLRCADAILPWEHLIYVLLWGLGKIFTDLS